jgi:hypothetical protein
MPHHPRRNEFIFKRLKRAFQIADAPGGGRLPARSSAGVGDKTLHALFFGNEIDGRWKRVGKVAGVGVKRQTPAVALEVRKVRPVRRLRSLFGVAEQRLRFDIKRKRPAFEQRLHRINRCLAVVDGALQFVPSFL